MTIMPEFEPLPYMWQSPGTGEPVANQSDIKILLKGRLKKRYSGRENKQDLLSN